MPRHHMGPVPLVSQGLKHLIAPLAGRRFGRVIGVGHDHLAGDSPLFAEVLHKVGIGCGVGSPAVIAVHHLQSPTPFGLQIDQQLEQAHRVLPTRNRH